MSETDESGQSAADAEMHDIIAIGLGNEAISCFRRQIVDSKEYESAVEDLRVAFSRSFLEELMPLLKETPPTGNELLEIVLNTFKKTVDAWEDRFHAFAAGKSGFTYTPCPVYSFDLAPFTAWLVHILQPELPAAATTPKEPSAMEKAFFKSIEEAFINDGADLRRMADLLGGATTKCWHCRKGANDLPVGTHLMACSKCKVANYCSSDCQKDNWKLHKIMCTGVPSDFIENKALAKRMAAYCFECQQKKVVLKDQQPSTSGGGEPAKEEVDIEAANEKLQRIKANVPTLKCFNKRMKMIKKSSWWPFSGEEQAAPSTNKLNTQEMTTFLKICSAFSQPESVNATAEVLHKQYGIPAPMTKKRFLYIADVYRDLPPRKDDVREVGAAGANKTTNGVQSLPLQQKETAAVASATSNQASAATADSGPTSNSSKSKNKKKKK